MTETQKALDLAPTSIRLGANHGYRFEADRVQLNSDIELRPGVSADQWSLQLWACTTPPSERTLGELTRCGSLVAQSALRVPIPLQLHMHRVQVEEAARVPPQGPAYQMILVVADRAGKVADWAWYDKLQFFSAPRFGGGVSYEIDGDSVRLGAERVENPRAFGSRSGSLRVELWALREPYRHDPPSGHCLASASLGTLDGEHHLRQASLLCDFQRPSPGTYSVALLLREWTAAGYLTRDIRLFSAPFFEAAAADVAPPQPASPELPASSTVDASEAVEVAGVVEAPPAVEAAFTAEVPRRPGAVVADEAAPQAKVEAEPVEVRADAEPPAKVEGEPVEVRADAELPAEANPKQSEVAEVSGAPPVAKGEPVAAAATATPAPARPAPVARASRGAMTGRLTSISRASVEELAKVKGLNFKIAKEIVRSRPFESLEELTRVRGIGPKMLGKLRSLLEL